ncbi:hypothetical protein B0T24DRAFT_632116 [Lasiosphaeria ovina]|uniref:Uncharacterized protein n=1 Tax=Lasiosphaeria ovina TaxID=92902 RepID=A0AAE0N3U4_9PEZI|nr:hypothetical protein B0T24DRAFT_632116 [Lasiosphaeria ovina]
MLLPLLRLHLLQLLLPLLLLPHLLLLYFPLLICVKSSSSSSNITKANRYLWLSGCATKLPGGWCERDCAVGIGKYIRTIPVIPGPCILLNFLCSCLLLWLTC